MYEPESLEKQKELLDILENRRLSSDLIELRDMLKARYELLLQGVHEDVTPEFSSYLERILNLDFVPDEYSYRRKTKSQRTRLNCKRHIRQDSRNLIFSKRF